MSANKLTGYERALKEFLKAYLIDGLRDFIGKGMSNGMSMADMGMADMEENVEVVKLPAFLEPFVKALLDKGLPEELVARLLANLNTNSQGERPSA